MPRNRNSTSKVNKPSSLTKSVTVKDPQMLEDEGIGPSRSTSPESFSRPGSPPEILRGAVNRENLTTNLQENVSIIIDRSFREFFHDAFRSTPIESNLDEKEKLKVFLGRIHIKPASIKYDEKTENYEIEVSPQQKRDLDYYQRAAKIQKESLLYSDMQRGSQIMDDPRNNKSSIFTIPNKLVDKFVVPLISPSITDPTLKHDKAFLVFSYLKQIGMDPKTTIEKYEDNKSVGFVVQASENSYKHFQGIAQSSGLEGPSILKRGQKQETWTDRVKSAESTKERGSKFGAVGDKT